jgi:hypothetical protein
MVNLRHAAQIAHRIRHLRDTASAQGRLYDFLTFQASALERQPDDACEIAQRLEKNAASFTAARISADLLQLARDLRTAAGVES